MNMCFNLLPSRKSVTLISILLSLLLSCNPAPKEAKKDPRPNIIVILADDMGFADIGAYGSEIPTPHLDALANNGVKYTQFYNAGRCCPTRASLLTGLYQHQAGVGHMAGGLTRNDSVLPAYQGFLNKQCVTIGEMLKSSGYETMHSGKWHVGNDRPYWPGQRGFDRHFSFINGAGSYFNLKPFWNESQKIDMVLDGEDYLPPKDGFYLTRSISDHGLKFIQERQPDQPFFLYLAYTAPHWPLHALKEDIEKFRGTYKKGWARIREERFERMKAMGIVGEHQEMSPIFDYNDTYTPEWENLSEEELDLWDLRMAVYAAMIYRMDQGIGQIVDHLKKTDQLDNTLIMFLSDNGACHEPMYEWDLVYPRETETGTPDSFDAYGYAWANASNTPFRLFKSWSMEGGIRTPFIAHWPDVIPPKTMNTTDVGHIIDIMATCLDVAQTTYPDEFDGNVLTPLEGESLLPSFLGNGRLDNRTVFWEHEGNQAVREGKWKLVHTRRSKGEMVRRWELYNLEEDFTELHDLSDKFPEKKAELMAKYLAWAEKVGVENWDGITRWD